MQRPDATRVAGFHTWKSLDRSVRKGSSGIAILAPMTRKIQVGDQLAGYSTQHGQVDDDGFIKRVSGFRVVHVFDVADTDGEPLPEGPRPVRLTGEGDGFARLASLASDIGYFIAYEEFPQQGKNGEANFATKTNTLRAGLDGAQFVKTLAHEIAHCLLHSELTTPREIAELEAESVAYLVCADLGLDSTQYTLPYIAGWSGGGEDACKAIQECGQRIVCTANEILDHVVKTSEEYAA